jgi:hypothetical protein
MRGMWAFLREWLFAVFGVGITTGLLLYFPFIRPLMSPETRIRLTLQPYYVVPVIIAVIAGVISWLRRRSFAALWVWVPQFVYVTYRIVQWSVTRNAGLGAATSHFLGRECMFPTCNDQLESTAYLYITLAYSSAAALTRYIGRTRVITSPTT